MRKYSSGLMQPKRQMLRNTLFALTCAASLCATASFAAHQAEYLDRGVVAMPSSNGIFISWRMLGDDPSNISFNVYRNGTKITSSPVTNSTNYFDASGTTNAAYTVRPIVNGTELAANAAKATWSDPYLVVNLNRPNNGTTPSGESYSYSPNDLSVGDLDGDGEYEIVVKWDPSNSKDNSQAGYTGNVFIDAYEMNGTRLWRIDLGKNIRAGAHYTQYMVYDLDGDGKAEVALRTAPGTKDAAGNVQGGANANTDYRNSDGRILSGAEYMTVFNGETGAILASTDYLPARGTVSSWGDSYGNRVDRFLAGIAYLDGARPSVVMTRGYYTRAVLVAWDWRNGQLTHRWTFDSNASGNSNYAGQGAHSLTVGDVDQDGKDEIVFGAATIDDNGKGLYSTRIGHGDALHLGDLLPSRPGLEVYMVHECPSCYGNNGVEMHDAKTGQVIWSIPNLTSDIGRGVTMDIDPRYAGSESWASAGGLYAANGTLISSAKPSSTNFAAYWDGDLRREILNGTTIDKWNYTSSNSSRLLSAYNNGAADNNSTKATPNLSADILGDWREEVIWRHSNNSQLLIFSTPIVTTNKLRTLMHDTQYREAIAWQNVGYNQPPHTSYFLGDGMAAQPAPALNFVGTNPNATAPVTSSRSSSSISSSRSSSSIAVSSSSANSSSSSSRSSSVAATGNCSYVVSNNWGAGFTGAIRITNNGSSAINGWTVNWNYSGGTRLSATWNANLSGSNPYSATPVSWNSTIQPGQSVEFGFQGTHSGNAEIPVVTGSACN